MDSRWEECQELIEQVFGEKPESPLELVQIMICMSDRILEAEQAGKQRKPKEPEKMS